MIQGKELYDSNIEINFVTEKVKINYDWYIENTFEEDITNLINKFLIFPFVIFHKIISYFIQPRLKKYFNQKKYLDFYIGIHKFIYGTTIESFSGTLFSNEITIFSKSNLEFKYNLTGEYEKYCENIKLFVLNAERSFHGKKYNFAKGFCFVIRFSQIPKVGTASIEYI